MIVSRYSEMDLVLLGAQGFETPKSNVPFTKNVHEVWRLKHWAEWASEAACFSKQPLIQTTYTYCLADLI